MAGINTGLYIGYSGLQAARAGLISSGNNVANVHTEGYSRQSAVVTPVKPLSQGRLQFGAGAQLDSIISLRDRLAERDLTQKRSTFAYNNAYSQMMHATEVVLQDSGNSGVGPALGQFFEAVEHTSSAPQEIAYRLEMLDKGALLSRTIRTQYEQISDANLQTNNQVGLAVDDINRITAKIAELNRQIGATPGPATSLVDERNQLVNELADFVDIQVYDLDNELVQINVSGMNALLVGRESSFDLVSQANAGNYNHYDVVIDHGGAFTNITNQINGGKLGALLQVRDVDQRTALRELDNLAAGVTQQINAVHNTGFALDGVTTGLNFFEPFVSGAPGPDNNLGAAINMRISTDVLGQPQNLALSGTGSVGDNAIALAMAQLRHTAATVDNNGDGIGDSGPFEQFHGVRMTQLGAAIQSSDTALQGQKLLLDQAQSRRDAVSAVSLDEEALNLSVYQKAFEANSRFMRVMDQLMGEIITSLGA